MKKETEEAKLDRLIKEGKSKLREINTELKINEDRYHQMIVEVEDYAIILLDEKGIIQKWNRGAEKIKLYSENEIIGKSFKTFYLPEDQKAKLPETLLSEAKEKGKAYHEGWRVRKDGTTFWGSVAITALHDSKNEVIGYSKVTRDLTEKKLADDQLKELTDTLKRINEELRKSEERYHKMIAEVQDYAIILLNNKGEIENWNMGAEFIKGYSAKEIIGKNFRIFYPEKDQAEGLPQKLLKEATDKGKSTHEGWRIRKDGSKFWGSIVITALHDDNRTVIGFSKVTRDLTERKNADDQLRSYAAELEIQNKELEQFAYVASHDLQEPLRKIQTFIEIVEKNLEDPEHIARFFDKIKAAARRMSDLIKSVLNYSKLSKGEERFEDVNLNQILDDVKTDFELLLEEKSAVFKSGILPVIKGIPPQLNQLFSNLVSNSLKFTAEKPIITVKSKVVDDDEVVNKTEELRPGKYFEIEFSDNGIGFEPQYEKQIFAMFQRLHGRHQYAGTGIGLALCKKIAENHNGYITAKSELGKGATFYVYFPAL